MAIKIINKNSLIVLSFLLSYFASAAGGDSTLIGQLRYKANASLKRLVIHNKKMIESGTLEKLNFVVEIDDSPLPVGDSAVFQRSVSDVSYNFISSEKHSELNTYLRQVYEQEGIACYMVFINYFNYKLSIRFSDNETITNIIAYQRKFNELQKNKKEDPLIENLKAIHEKVSDDVYQQITKDHPFVFMDIAAYCTSGGSGLVCDYFGKYYLSGLTNNAILPHLRELIKRKFNLQYEQYIPKETIAENEVYSLAASVIQAKIKSQILTSTNQESLCSILNESDFPFSGETFVSTAYAALTIEERIHAIKVFLQGRVGGTWSNCNAEQKLISIVKNTPPEQIDNFLEQIETEKLINELVSAIDDFGPGGNNYESLLKVFSELLLKSPTFEQRFYDYQNASLTSSRFFIWDRSYFLSLSHTPVGNNKYSVELLDNQQVKVIHSYVKEWRLTGYQAKSEIPLYEEVWESDPNPAYLRPFDLILFIDNSRLGLIDGGIVGGELGMAVMPAIFLKYAYDKRFNANTLKGIAIAVDVATLITGPGIIAKVFQAGNRIRQALVIADIVNSGLNLSINLVEAELDPRFSVAVDMYNKLMIGIGAGRIVKNGLVKAGDVLNQLGDFAKTLEKEAVKNYLTAIIALRTQLKEANFDIIEYCKKNKSAESIFAMEDQLRKEWQLRFPNESLPLPTNSYLNVSDELQNAVRAKIPNKAEELLDVLNTNSELRQAMSVDPDLVATWAQVTKASLLELRSDIAFLREFKDYIQRSGNAFAGHFEETFELYLKGKNTGSWSDLNSYVNQHKLNSFPPGSSFYFPPSNGGFNVAENVSLLPGMKFDRYQQMWNGLDEKGNPVLTGPYTSPIDDNGSIFSYPQRALRVDENVNALYYEIEVLKELPFKGELADVIPWWGKTGLGKQMKFNFNSDLKNWNDLVRAGYVKITIKAAPSGVYQSYIGQLK